MQHLDYNPYEKPSLEGSPLLEPIFENIPETLKNLSQWVLWRGVWNAEKNRWEKKPYRVNGSLASSTDPNTWTSFDEAVIAYKKGGFSGIGFVVTDQDSIVGFDVDHCVENGVIADWAKAIIEAMNCYWEISPSGTGIRIFLKGKLPPGGRKKGNVECYETGRFLTVTGHKLPDSPCAVLDRQEALNEFHAKYFPVVIPLKPRHTPTLTGFSVNDTELLERAFNAKNGSKLKTLYDGDFSGYPSQSEADLALCVGLAFWTGDNPDRLDRLFRASGLYRDKWDVKHGAHTYGEMTVTKAISGTSEFYNWDKFNGNTNGTKPTTEPKKPRPASSFDEDYTDETLAALEQLNKRFAVIRHNPQCLWDNVAQKPISLAHFRLLLKNHKGQYLQLGDDGPRVVSKPLAYLWETWSERREHDEVDLLPEQPTTAKTLNLWQGWGGSLLTDGVDATLWTLHLNVMFGLKNWDGSSTSINEEQRAILQADRDYFEAWLAYPIQNPGAKLRTMALLWSCHQGVGKTTITELMQELYGEHFLEVDSEFFNSNFNGSLVGKLFVSAEEVLCDGRFIFMNRLKSLITSPRVNINVKHGAQFEAVNRFNLLATSNHPNALHLDDQDRRVFVHEITAQNPPSDYFNRLYQWGESQAGKDSLFTHLKNLDLADFNPHAHARVMESKLRMIDNSRSDLDRWIAELEFSDLPDLVELNELLEKARAACPSTRLQGNTLSAAFNRTVIEIRRMSKTYKQIRLVAIRDCQQWRTADGSDWGKFWRGEITKQEIELNKNTSEYRSSYQEQSLEPLPREDLSPTPMVEPHRSNFSDLSPKDGDTPSDLLRYSDTPMPRKSLEKSSDDPRGLI